MRVDYGIAHFDPLREGTSVGVAALASAYGGSVFETYPRLIGDDFFGVGRNPIRAARWAALAAGRRVNGRILHLFEPGLDIFRRPVRIDRAGLRLQVRPLVVTAICSRPLDNVDQPGLTRLRRTLAAVVVEDARDRDSVADLLGLPVFAIHPAARPLAVLPLPASGPFTLASLSSPLEPAQIRAKGYPELIAAIARLPDIRLDLLWRGSACLDEVRALIRQHGVDDRVRILPERTPLLEVIGGAHAVVALFRPGLHAKAVPQSVLDGLATGRPALVAEGSAIAHLLRPSGAAVISAVDPDAIATGITELYSATMTMHGHARRAAEEIFSVDRFLAAYTEVYRTAEREANPGRKEHVAATRRRS